MNKKCCACYRNSDNYDYVIERLVHMRDEINYIIQVLEHKSFKDASKDVLEDLENELSSYPDDYVDDAMEYPYYINNTSPYKHRYHPHMWFY